MLRKSALRCIASVNIIEERDLHFLGFVVTVHFNPVPNNRKVICVFPNVREVKCTSKPQGVKWIFFSRYIAIILKKKLLYKINIDILLLLCISRYNNGATIGVRISSSTFAIVAKLVFYVL